MKVTPVLSAWRKRRLKKMFPDGMVSPHFRYIEFATKDGTPIPVKAKPGLEKLCRVFLEPMRDEFGKAYITSGYRHRAYNESLSGTAENSYHIWDEHPEEVAADVVFARGTTQDWEDHAKKLRDKNNRGLGGINAYRVDGFIHMDVRNSTASDWKQQ